MKALPPSFFNLFNYSDKEDIEKEGITQAVLDYTHHPYIIIGSFIKGVENFYIICQGYHRQYGRQFERVEQTVKQKYFDRLYTFLENFKENNLEHVLQVQDFDHSEITFAFDQVISFYESTEEYEKCARLHKILHVITAVEVGDLV